MGAEVIIGAIGLGLSAAGTVAGVVAQQQATRAAKDAERARTQQMDLEAARQRRQIAQRATVARATALSNATNQGAAQGSGLQGGFGQIAGEAGRATVAVNQNQDIGHLIFDANSRYSSAMGRANTASAVSGFGNMFLNNMDLFKRVGSYLFNQPTGVT